MLRRSIMVIARRTSESIRDGGLYSYWAVDDIHHPTTGKILNCNPFVQRPRIHRYAIARCIIQKAATLPMA